MCVPVQKEGEPSQVLPSPERNVVDASFLIYPSLRSLEHRVGAPSSRLIGGMALYLLGGDHSFGMRKTETQRFRCDYGVVPRSPLASGGRECDASSPACLSDHRVGGRARWGAGSPGTTEGPGDRSGGLDGGVTVLAVPRLTTRPVFCKGGNSEFYAEGSTYENDRSH